jgi:serine phosphatase RsbU (regulator of sigma subunit)
MKEQTNPAYHKVLERQIKKLLGKGAIIPNELLHLFQTISDTYTQYEADNQFIAHTMDVSSQELTASNYMLLEQKEALQIAYEQLRSTQAQLEEKEKIVAISKELETAYKLLKTQTIELQHAHINHQAAIQRAKRIQNALLPSRHKIASNFSEFFVLYYPLDVVSGDFYWFAEVYNIKILVVGDCTGHGVPGAFMTIMASALLEEIINTNEIISPAKILKILDKKITSSLMQGNDSTHDGMDISIVAIHEEEKIMLFAGSKHILYQIREEKMTEFKGSIFEIGGHVEGEIKSFENTTIPYLKTDSYYMTTDGYQSQFNNKREKFMRKRLKETIMSYAILTMEEQRIKFKETLKNWQGTMRQTDDILLVGFRI